MNTDSIDAAVDRLARRAEAFECFGVRQRDLSANFEAGRLKSAQTNQRGGVGFRVVVSGRLAVGGTPDPTALDKTIDSTIEAGDFGDPFEFQFAPRSAGPRVDVYDPQVPQMQVADLVATGKEVIERLADLGDGATVNVSVDAGEDFQVFANSAGQRFDYQATHYGVSITVDCFGQDDIFSVGEFQESCRGQVDLDWLVETVRRKFEQARTVVAPGRPDQPLVFTPGGLQGLLVPLLAGLNGQNVTDGVSPLADKRGGAAILDEKLTLTDDGTLPGRPGSQPFDDEGTPVRRTVLVGNGRVENFLLDLRTAQRLNLVSTGNASRGLTSPPVPGTNNLLLAPGEAPLERLLSAVGDGLLVEYLLGAGQGNVAGGDYSNPIGLAYKIRDGEIIGRVKNCSLAGNVYEDFKQVTAIEDRGHWYGSVCLPHVRIDTMHVAVGE